MTELDLRETLERHLGGVDVRPGDPRVAVQRGRRLRRRRRRLSGTALALVLAGVAAAGAGFVASRDGGSTTAHYAGVGPLDFSHGARAYADPGEELHLAGRTFPYGDLDYLDTDAVATSYGMVFFDHGRPMLLGADGEVRPLVAGPVDAPEGFRPTAKWDPARSQVAFATLRDGTATLTVYDLAAGQAVATREVACGASCPVVVDAVDGGVAVVRLGDGTYLWRADAFDRIGGPDVRVADLRDGVLLWSGEQPDVSGYRLVEGAVDAELTFDGRYVLDWSSRLRATDGGPDLVLAQGPTRQYALGFWAVDSDGSVLVARVDRTLGYSNYLVYDCAVPSGACEELGPLRTTGGDPEFIGVDM